MSPGEIRRIEEVTAEIAALEVHLRVLRVELEALKKASSQVESHHSTPLPLMYR